MTEYKYYRCPSCFENVREEYDIEKEGVFPDDFVTSRKCEFCEIPNLSSHALLRRRIEVMPWALASDFPKVIKHFYDEVFAHNTLISANIELLQEQIDNPEAMAWGKKFESLKKDDSPSSESR